MSEEEGENSVILNTQSSHEEVSVQEESESKSKENPKVEAKPQTYREENFKKLDNFEKEELKKTLSPSLPPKSIYTKITEELMQGLHTRGEFQFAPSYDNLLNGNLISLSLSSKNLKNGINNKIISGFLQRNASYNIKNVLPNSVSQQNGLIKVKLSSREESKRNIHNVRTPEKYLEDQLNFVEEKKKKIELNRQKLEEEKKKTLQPKPKINAKSNAIAKKLIKDKNIYTRLFHDNPKKTREKNNNILHYKKKSLCYSRKTIDDCVNKLYREGVEKTKKRGESNIPCHMEKVSMFYSRDLSSYKSNIRTNPKKDSFSFSSSRTTNEDVSKNNLLILINGLLKEIDEVEKETEVDFTKFLAFLFEMGYTQFNHKKIQSLLSKGEAEFIDYNTFNGLEDIITGKENFDDNCDGIEDQIKAGYVTKISKDTLVQEQKKIIAVWNLLIKNFDLLIEEEKLIGENEKVQMTSIKFFSLIISGLYSFIPNRSTSVSEISATNSTPYNTQINSPLITKSKCLNNAKSNKTLTTNNSKSSREGANDYIMRTLSINLSELSKNLNTKKIKLQFRLFEENREKLIQYKKGLQKFLSKTKNQELTFHPKIDKKKGKSLKLESTYLILQQKHLNEIEKLQKEKINQEMKGCTFTPNNRKVDPAKSIEISERLYSACKNKKKDGTASSQFATLDKECTFTPVVNQELNPEIFTCNPIKNDPLLIYKIDQYEKARIEKQLINFIYYQGGSSIAKLRNSDDLFKEFQNSKALENFKFGIEQKTNKDTFDKFLKGNNYEYVRRQVPLFTIEVKIKDRIELLDYYKNDDPVKITKNFCKKHNLGESSNEKILAVIEDKLKNTKELSDSNNS